MRPYFPYPRVLMPVEMEAKMKLENVERMVGVLKEQGAVQVGEYFETNAFYDTDDRTLLAADEGLRIRIAQELHTGKTRCMITHKGPNDYGPLKSRPETELEVASADSAALLLERLGYVRHLRFQKRRLSFRLDGCKIELDEIPHLGHFIEIEGPDSETILRMRDRLGLAKSPLIKTSYVAMLASHLQERGQPIADIEFPPSTQRRLAIKAG